MAGGDRSAHEGRYWTPVEGGKILCQLCPRACRLGEGQRAFCFVRMNEGGRMVLTTYGRSPDTYISSELRGRSALK